MKKTLFKTFLALIFIAGAVYQTNAQDVNGSIGAVKRGGSVKGTVVFTLPDGLHANSSRPSGESLIPTTVKITAVGAKVGGVSYPRGTNRKFDFSEDTLNVYEGRTAFGFNLSVPANFKGSTVKVRAVVRFQACTNEVCYPPKTKEVTLTAQVK